jgi:hypothetical protein
MPKLNHFLFPTSSVTVTLAQYMRNFNKYFYINNNANRGTSIPIGSRHSTNNLQERLAMSSHKTIYCAKYTYHYTYLITNIENDMMYIGLRSCACAPQDDIGKTYISSSHDHKFIKEQQQHPERFNYEVIIMTNSDEEWTKIKYAE